MITKETYTKIFLKHANISLSEAAIKEYTPVWWQNTRIKDEGGLRLTNEGFEFIQETLGLTVFEVPFPRDFKITTQVVIFLDKFIDCPYYLTERSLWVTDEKKALELHLFSGDVKKYGIIKALKRQEKD